MIFSHDCERHTGLSVFHCRLDLSSKGRLNPVAAGKCSENEISSSLGDGLLSKATERCDLTLTCRARAENELSREHEHGSRPPYAGWWSIERKFRRSIGPSNNACRPANNHLEELGKILPFTGIDLAIFKYQIESLL